MPLSRRSAGLCEWQRPAKQMRKKLGIRANDRVEIASGEKSIVIRPIPDFFALKSFLGTALPREEELRKMRDAVAAHVRGGKR